MKKENIETNITNETIYSTNVHEEENVSSEVLTDNQIDATMSASDIQSGEAELVLMQPLDETANVATASVECCDDCCEDKASTAEMDNAVHLTLNEWRNDTITSSISERWYKFSTNEADTYTIYTSGSTDTIGSLYDENGDRVTLNDDRAGSLNFRIVYPLDANSTYYVKVTTPQAQTGEFSIRVIKRILVSQVIVSEESVTLNVGDTYTLNASVYPSNADNQELFFSSNDISVAAVDSSSGEIVARGTGIATITVADKEGTGTTGKCEVWVKGKTPVFLIHGRNSNSFEVWGANNRISSNPFDVEDRNNNHFDCSVNAMSEGGLRVPYIEKASQEIYSYKLGAPIKVDGKEAEDFTVEGIFNGEFKDGEYISTHSEGGNLAYALKKEEGYAENINLFAFNYPNQDAVVHDAVKFKAYIENLIYYIRTSKNEDAELMKFCFYASSQDYNNNHYTFNIVGHSMGGLVARYYIENLGQDTHVEKLITICTPHWGSGLADASNITGVLHYLCDHDLRIDSAMFGGSFSPELNCNAIGFNCYNSEYTLTGELLYNKEIFTKYYVISGLDYHATDIAEENLNFEIGCHHTTFEDIEENLQYCTENKLYEYIFYEGQINKSFIDIKAEGDNTVGFLSQIGVTESGADIPEKKIKVERIFVCIDNDGGNNAQRHLHGKIPHREKTIEKVIDYLG